MSLAELANQAQGLEGLTVSPTIDPSVSGLEPQEGGISFPVEALVAVPTISGTLSGITPQETSTPVPEIPENPEKPVDYTTETQFNVGDKLSARDAAPVFHPQGSAEFNIQEKDTLTITGPKDSAGNIPVIHDRTGAVGVIFVGDANNFSHLDYFPIEQNQAPDEPTPVPTPIETPVSEEVALAQDEPMTEDQPEESKEGSEDSKIPADLLSAQGLDGMQPYFNGGLDTQSTGQVVTDDGFVKMTKEVAIVQGQIRVKVNAYEPNDDEAHPMATIWVPLSGFKQEISSLSVSDLINAGFSLIPGSEIPNQPTAEEEALINERLNGSAKVEGRRPLNRSGYFALTEVFPLDFDINDSAKSKFNWGIDGEVSEVLVKDKEVTLVFNTDSYRSDVNCITGVDCKVDIKNGPEKTIKVVIPDIGKFTAFRVVRQWTGDKQHAERTVPIDSNGWTIKDFENTYVQIPLSGGTLSQIIQTLQNTGRNEVRVMVEGGVAIAD